MGFISKLKNEAKNALDKGSKENNKKKSEKKSNDNSVSQKSPQKKKKKPTKVNSSMSAEEMLMSIQGEENNTEDIDPSEYIQTKKAGGRSRDMIIKQLHINDSMSIPEDFISPDEIANVEFSVSVPSGLDTDEVSQFCDIMEDSIAGYRKALKDAYSDKNSLLEEIARVEKQIVEKRNDETLNAFLTQGSNEKEQLQNSLVDMRVENETLKERLKKLEAGEATDVLPNVNDDNSQILNLNNKIKELETSLHEKEQLLMEAKELQSKSPVETDKLKDQLNELKSRNNELTLKVTEYNNLETELSKKTEENNRLHKNLENSVSADEHKALLSQIAELKASNEAMVADNETLKASLNNDKGSHKEKELTEKLIETNSQVASLSSELEKTKTTKQTLISQLEQEKQAKIKLEEQVAQYEEQDSNVSLLKEEIKKYKEELERIKSVSVSPVENKIKESKGNTEKLMEDMEDSANEEKIMKQFIAKHGKNKKHVRVPQQLTGDDIKAMKDGEKKSTLNDLIRGNKPKDNIPTPSSENKETSDDTFSSMLKDFQ